MSKQPGILATLISKLCPLMYEDEKSIRTFSTRLKENQFFFDGARDCLKWA